MTQAPLQVVAVAARDLSRAKEFARKHDLPKAYGSYEELAKDPNVGEWGGPRGATGGAAFRLLRRRCKALRDEPIPLGSWKDFGLVGRAIGTGFFVQREIAIRGHTSAVKAGLNF